MRTVIWLLVFFSAVWIVSHSSWRWGPEKCKHLIGFTETWFGPCIKDKECVVLPDGRKLVKVYGPCLPYCNGRDEDCG